MTESKLSHTAATENTSNAAPSLNSNGGVAGNTSSIQGVNNPAIGGGEKREKTTAEEMSITSGNDGALKNLAADVKGNDHTAPDDTGALRHKGVASHELSIPETPDRSRPHEKTGDSNQNTLQTTSG